jgi:hypothetical protein
MQVRKRENKRSQQDKKRNNRAGHGTYKKLLLYIWSIKRAVISTEGYPFTAIFGSVRAESYPFTAVLGVISPGSYLPIIKITLEVVS